MFNDTSSPLSLLKTRRSGKPRDLVAPGPDAAQLREMLEIAIRTPDHGKIGPWRFIIIKQDQREAFAKLLEGALRAGKDSGKDEVTPEEIEAARTFALQAPCLVVLVSSPDTSRPIPVWEQELSAGAAAMNLLHAAHAMGFAGGWLTAWPAFSDIVRDAFGSAPDRIAGFLFIGTPARELQERPRPKYEDVVSVWTPPA
ncbi:MAG: nitroreductase [Sphingomonadales bacterium]|nr:MAG: nitroreductase [Sphingomonadales bacterium]TNF02003.1 MAG: nitroreductase [Sphingomonadales bacterium]